MRLLTEIAPEQLIEIFEILCAIPNEETTIFDTEPRTTRHPVIESMIDEITLQIQINEHYED